MRRDPAGGLSLLEVLLALAITGMIGVALASMFATGNRVWERTAALGDVAAQGAARHRLRERLEAMPEVSPDWPLPRLFAASGTEVRFVARLPEAGEAAWSAVAFDAREGRLTWLDATQAPGTPATVLRENLAEASIRFYGRKTAYAEAGWSEDWDEALLLPLLIRIETVRAGGLPEPPLIVRPARLLAHSVMSASSLVPPGWPSAP